MKNLLVLGAGTAGTTVVNKLAQVLDDKAWQITIVDQDRSWIEANLKETQLTHVDVGQRVDIAIDSYPDAGWSGQVASISAATGAEFALIPPQNASGKLFERKIQDDFLEAMSL